jgi:hypothetical protein
MNDQTLITTSQNTAALQPSTFEQLERFAKYLANSDFAPKDFKSKPNNILIAMQMGAEVGLKPMQAIQNVAVINGRPCLWGDSMLAIVKARSDCEFVDETLDEKKMVAICKVKRKNQPICERIFTWDDAKKANLLNKNTWTQYPKRMLQMRARAFALRDSFPDALKGFAVAEEVQDYNQPEKPAFKQINETPESAQKEPPTEDFTRSDPGLIDKLQLKEITTLIQEREVDSSSFYNHYQISELSELTIDQYSQAIQLLLKKPLRSTNNDEELLENSESATKEKKSQEAMDTLHNIMTKNNITDDTVKK